MVFLLALTAPAAAADAPAAFVPHYVSVRGATANLREGPSYDHRILWIYQHKDYPLKEIATFDAWRKVKDVDGVVGWMHHTQLSDRRTVLFVGFTKSDLHETDDPHSRVIAHAGPGVVARLKACKLQVCEVEASGTDGWVDKRDIWGVDVGEVFQ
ncbi:MAG: aspartyl-trna synthetase [Alphaproteobacteria bacterium]|nr:aspartyl-trna synthetase [Alphaproteobacteria bacterium]MBL7096105.1 aspartyl-trna synthetase [Alphaproteobacteria bacterium]